MAGEPIPLPSSSALVKVLYDADAATLDVEFRQGEEYRYFLVPRSVVDELIASDSAGRYFSDRIRPRFKEERLR